MKLPDLKNKRNILIAVLLSIFIIKVLTIISFNNTDWEPDSYMHFLQAKTVWLNFPSNLPIGLSVWAKPLFIYPMGLIINLLNQNTFFVVQLINTLIFLLISYLVI